MTAQEFKSPWWLPDGHTQTLWRRFVPGNNLHQRRQRVELSDGDFIDVDWVDGPGDQRRPVVFLLHGLCGSSGSPYIVSLQCLLQQHGYTSVAMNFRGCSGEINRLARAYHSGCSDDVEEVYHAVRREVGDRPFAFVGFSLGGNVLLNWLAQLGSSHSVLGGVAVSTPFSLAYCSEALNSGMSAFYGRYFRGRLVRDVEAKRAWFRHKGWHQEVEKLAQLGELRRLQTLWEFDDQVTAPLHGFADAPDYYARCSSGSVLSAIKVPALLIQSRNDPIIPARSLPDHTALPERMKLLLTEAGGHVGFTSASDSLWLERRILEAIRQFD
jgi:predicted alpha/beta-fold hydrolase